MQKNRPTRVVIDTNLWISFVISNNFSKLDKLIYSGKLKILINGDLISELEETIKKPKLQKYFLSRGIAEMLAFFEPYIELINGDSKVTLCRDPKDDFLLSLAKDGKADFLLTGDKDLLDMKFFRKTKIIPFAAFIEMEL